MHAFEINKHGKIVFPSNCFPDLDFSTFESLEQLDAVVRRDFDAKAPTGTYILEQIKTGAYTSKFELMRDMALNLFWANRFKITMFEVRPTRWADVPRTRDDVFVPILTPWKEARDQGDCGVVRLPGSSRAVGRRSRGRHLRDPLRRVRPSKEPRDETVGRRTHGCRAALRSPQSRHCGFTNSTPTSAGTATPRSSTAMRTWPSWRRYIAGRWSCTTSTHGIATRPPWSPSKSCATTTTWWCFIRVISEVRPLPDPHRRRSSAKKAAMASRTVLRADSPVPRASTCATTSRYNLASMAIARSAR